MAQSSSRFLFHVKSNFGNKILACRSCLNTSWVLAGIALKAAGTIADGVRPVYTREFETSSQVIDRNT